MLLVIGSLILGLLNLGVIIGMKKQWHWAPWMMLLMQLPWTAYDIATHQYGFLALSVACTITAITMIRTTKRQPKMRNCKVNDRVMFTVRIDNNAMLHMGIVTALDEISTWVQYTYDDSVLNVRVDDPDDVEPLR